MRVKLTLNRCHKAVERLKMKRNSLKAEIETLLKPIEIAIAPGITSESITQLNSGVEVSSKLQLLFEVCEAIKTIKVAVSKKNHANNINEALAENESLTFILQTLQGGLYPKKEKDRYYREDPKDKLAPMKIEDAVGYLQKITSLPNPESVETQSFKIARISEGVKKELDNKITEVQNMSFHYLDKTSDLNRDTVEIELPATVAPFAGLKDER